MINKLDYNIDEFPFRRAVGDMLGIKDHLEELHTMTEVGPIVKPGADSHSLYHRMFYDRVRGSEFMEIYRRFVKVLRWKAAEPIIYQAQPTFRIHYVGNLGVGAFHRDSDYNHPQEELNYWVPLTQCYGTNTIWLESARGRHDYHPERLGYGDVLRFPGGVLMHGNKVNDTKITRVSFDFRVITKAAWIEPKEVKKGITFGRSFTIGDSDEHYYRELL